MLAVSWSSCWNSCSSVKGLIDVSHCCKRVFSLNSLEAFGMQGCLVDCSHGVEVLCKSQGDVAENMYPHNNSSQSIYPVPLPSVHHLTLMAKSDFGTFQHPRSKPAGTVLHRKTMTHDNLRLSKCPSPIKQPQPLGNRISRKWHAFSSDSHAQPRDLRGAEAWRFSGAGAVRPLVSVTPPRICPPVSVSPTTQTLFLHQHTSFSPWKSLVNE